MVAGTPFPVAVVVSAACLLSPRCIICYPYCGCVRMLCESTACQDGWERANLRSSKERDLEELMLLSK